jgi:acetyl-CoA acetyltransferase
MKDIAVVSYCRLGIARAQRGALAATHGIPMAAHVLEHAVKRAGVEPAGISDVVLGCGLPEGATGHNVARNAAVAAGLFRGMDVCAVQPEEMSIAIAPAIRSLMKRHSVDAGSVDLWELHEAFAVTTLYNQKVLDTPWDRTNVNGGAVPLGHPYGMSGVRYVGSTLLELGRRKAKRAVIGVCTAGGMATAALVERA